MAEREAFIDQLLDLGISRNSVVQQVRKRFELSRSQAFKLIAGVADARKTDGTELPTPRGTEGLREAIGVIHSATVDTYLEGDYKELAKLSKELRELCKCLGIGAALGGAQPHDSDGLGEVALPQQVDPPLEVVAASRAMKAAK